MRRLALAAISVVLAAFCLATITASPAYACSCGPDAFAFFEEDEVELAFIGTVMEQSSLFGRPDTITTFETESVLVGEIGPTVHVRAPSSSASCGLSADVGNQLAVIAFKQSGVWTTISCDTGTLEQAAGFGDPRPPDPAISPGHRYTNSELTKAAGGLAALSVAAGVVLIGLRHRRVRHTIATTQDS